MVLPANEEKPADEQDLRAMKHEIKNQLSNIHLAIEQLRYEVENPSTDYTFCIDTIAMSCTKINNIIQNIE